MARFFKFKSLDDLQAAAGGLDVSLSLQDDLAPLFQGVDVGGRHLANRMAIQPMEGCDGTREGLPGELTNRRYRRFGAGGAKLIWGEATAISDEGRMNPRQLWLHEGSVTAIGQMLETARTAHREAFGTNEEPLIGLQLTHSGRWSYRRPLIAYRDRLLDPITKIKSTGTLIDDDYPVLTDDELRQIEDQYLVAAKLARRAGADFIDLKQCHRYLLNELLSATERPGPYGGTLEGRTRLVRRVIERIRSEVPDLLIATRMNAYDGVPFREGAEGAGEPVPANAEAVMAFGTRADAPEHEDLAEPIRLAQWLVDWGISLVNVSAGNPYASPHLLRPAENPPVDGYGAPEHPLRGVARHFRLTEAIQQAVSVPVIGSGYSWLQDFAFHAGAANLARGAVGLVGYGRGSLAHPDFVKTLSSEGRLERKQICRTFSYCTNLMRTKDHPLGQYPTGCPPFDKEAYGLIWTEAKTKPPASTAKKLR